MCNSLLEYNCSSFFTVKNENYRQAIEISCVNMSPIGWDIGIIFLKLKLPSIISLNTRSCFFPARFSDVLMIFLWLVFMSREQFHMHCFYCQQEVLESVQQETSVVDDWGCHILLLSAVLFPLRSSITQHMNTIISRIFQATEKGQLSIVIL